MFHLISKGWCLRLERYSPFVNGREGWCFWEGFPYHVFQSRAFRRIPKTLINIFRGAPFLDFGHVCSLQQGVPCILSIKLTNLFFCVSLSSFIPLFFIPPNRRLYNPSAMLLGCITTNMGWSLGCHWFWLVWRYGKSETAARLWALEQKNIGLICSCHKGENIFSVLCHCTWGLKSFSGVAPTLGPVPSGVRWLEGCVSCEG